MFFLVRLPFYVCHQSSCFLCFVHLLVCLPLILLISWIMLTVVCSNGVIAAVFFDDSKNKKNAHDDKEQRNRHHNVSSSNCTSMSCFFSCCCFAFVRWLLSIRSACLIVNGKYVGIQANSLIHEMLRNSIKIAAVQFTEQTSVVETFNMIEWLMRTIHLGCLTWRKLMIYTNYLIDSIARCRNAMKMDCHFKPFPRHNLCRHNHKLSVWNQHAELFH